MTEWKRFNNTRKCGHCGLPIYPGQPVRVLRFFDPKHPVRLMRCATCSAADGLYPPPDLPPLVQPDVQTVTRRESMTRIGELVRSGRDRQVGEDE